MDELFLWSVLFVGWRGTCSHLSRSSHIKSFAINSQLSFLVSWNLVELSSLYTSYPCTVFQPLFLGRLHDTGAAICYFISFASWNNFSLTQRTVDWYCKTLEIEVAVCLIYSEVEPKGQGHFRLVETRLWPHLQEHILHTRTLPSKSTEQLPW